MTINIDELRRLAQAALAGPDGVSLNWVKLLQDFQKTASPAAILELLGRFEAAEKEIKSWKGLAEEFGNKADNLSATARHEADCVEAAKAEIESLRAKIEAMERQEIGFRERCTPSSPTGYSNRFPLYALPGAQGE